MNFEKQATEMISTYAQLQQDLWDSWEILMQGWIATFYHAVDAWEKAKAGGAKAPLALRRLESEPKSAAGIPDTAEETV